MAFSRKFLKEVLEGCDNRDEMIDKIIEAHIEVVAPLKAELNQLTEENDGKTAEELHAEVDRIETEIAKLKEAGAGEVDENGIPWKDRYEAIRDEYKAAKTEGDKRAAYEEKAKAFRSLLINEGVNYSVVDLGVRGSGDIINSMEMQDGKVRNHESISAAIRSEFKDFIGKGTPVKSYAAAPTRESIMNITDRAERLAAIQRNPQLFSD